MSKAATAAFFSSGRLVHRHPMTPSKHHTRYAVISPHLDDGIFGCGQLLAAHPGGVVITVFAGKPPPGASLTSWDSAGGFAGDSDVIALRRNEDEAALGLLGARPVWLDFRDRQYRGSPTVEALASRIESELARLQVEAVMMPLGLHHGDHRLVHTACMQVRRRDFSRDWFIFEDAIYRRYAGLVTQKLSELEIEGVRLKRVDIPPGSLALKRAAVQCYASQLKALDSLGFPGYADVFEPEAYWHIQAG